MRLRNFLSNEKESVDRAATPSAGGTLRRGGVRTTTDFDW
jgi:hypothetical protein